MGNNDALSPDSPVFSVVARTYRSNSQIPNYGLQLFLKEKTTQE